ncbi:MAG: DUF2232 domain-containing protein [Gammaproteobacteria bacterium]|nr:DUF2232 domain-containing protein [Gammaproteobacteria bacterium]
MMGKLATYIMAGRLQAATAVLGFVVLAFVLPPLSLLSGAALALVTLRSGASNGLQVAALALAVATALGWLALGTPSAGLIFGLVQWAPVFILALVLRYTISLRLAVGTAAVLGLVLLGVLHTAVPDLAALWTALLDEYFRTNLEQVEVPAEQIDETLQTASVIMTGAVVSSLMLVAVLSLLIARWWQSVLYNPGGFRSEFQELRLGRPLAIVGTALLVAAYLQKSSALTEAALVALLPFLLQGIAVVHGLSARSANPVPWLIGLYALLIIAMPQMMAALIALGVMDNFVDLRRRFGSRQGQGED